MNNTESIGVIQYITLAVLERISHLTVTYDCLTIEDLTTIIEGGVRQILDGESCHEHEIIDELVHNITVTIQENYVALEVSG